MHEKVRCVYEENGFRRMLNIKNEQKKAENKLKYENFWHFIRITQCSFYVTIINCKRKVVEVKTAVFFDITTERVYKKFKKF